ncbi:MAG: DMT family transporter [Dehalococcoidia bacterium]
MLAPLFALLASASFASTNIFIRRGTLWVEPTQGVRLTVLLGVPIFALLATVFGEMVRLGEIPWQAYLLFGSAGAIHFVLGRSAMYFAIQAIGASRSGVIVAVAPLFSIVIAVPLFGESFAWTTALGTLLVILGPILMLQGETKTDNPGPGQVGASTAPAQLTRGMLQALGAALFWGISPILIKAGLNQADLPLLGALISYSVAAIFMGSLLVNRGPRQEFVRMDQRGLQWFFLASLSASLAQFLRYLALSKGDVILVSLLTQTTVVFVFLMTFLINRDIEALNSYVIVGGIVVMLGAALIVS